MTGTKVRKIRTIIIIIGLVKDKVSTKGWPIAVQLHR